MVLLRDNCRSAKDINWRIVGTFLTAHGKMIAFILLALATIRVAFSSSEFRPNLFVLSDITNEPDDSQSLVRLLLYSNQIEILGLTAVTSVWLNDTVRPDAMVEIINSYDSVLDNLRVHDPKYPSGDHLRSLVHAGKPKYGMEAVDLKDPANISEGAAALIDAVDGIQGESSDDDVRSFLWVSCWGGTNVLAEALNKVKQERTQDELDYFISKMKVYTISDQDNSGMWIRVNFPKLFYVNSIHAWNEYVLAQWVGISTLTIDQGGPNVTVVGQDWLSNNIQVGPLGASYPDIAYTMEGDTPSFLGVIPNGLNHPGHIEYGGWGGRYKPVDQSLLYSNHYSDTTDSVVGLNGETFTSNHACIWRWRHVFQNDFAARMQWTVRDSYESANHAPILVLNETTSPLPFHMTVEDHGSSNASLIFDASASYDPDSSNSIATIDLFQYTEVSGDTAPELTIQPVCSDSDSPCGIFSVLVPSKSVVNSSIDYHLVLQATDNGTPEMTAYRRIIISA